MLFGIVEKPCCPDSSVQEAGNTPLHGLRWARLQGSATGLCKIWSVTEGRLAAESSPRRSHESSMRHLLVLFGMGMSGPLRGIVKDQSGRVRRVRG